MEWATLIEGAQSVTEAVELFYEAAGEMEGHVIVTDQPETKLSPVLGGGIIDHDAADRLVDKSLLLVSVISTKMRDFPVVEYLQAR